MPVHPEHRQAAHRVRFEWGLDGAAAIAAGADVAVVADVLSFTTSVSVALDRDIAVLPYRWADPSADEYATRHDAALAVGRSKARKARAQGRPAISLSPADIRTVRPVPSRLVLPSPNGSTICFALADEVGTCVAGCLRNAAAVAGWIARTHHDATIAVVAAGERWDGSGLRPAIEDAWGAGAVIAHLGDLGRSERSPEAEFALAAWESIADDPAAALRESASGRELIAEGYADDVAIAAEVDGSHLVPVLRDGMFRAA